jgi:hypothetical protein
MSATWNVFELKSPVLCQTVICGGTCGDVEWRHADPGVRRRGARARRHGLWERVRMLGCKRAEADAQVRCACACIAGAHPGADTGGRGSESTLSSLNASGSLWLRLVESGGDPFLVSGDLAIALAID